MSSQDKMPKEDQIAKLEALLFLHGEPLTVKKLEQLLELKSGEGEELLRAFEEKLTATHRGLGLLWVEGKVQLTTQARFAPLLKSFLEKEFSEDLTPASLETLSLILYFGPISRSRLEYLRGVNSIFTLRSLLMRGLIERLPDPEYSQSYLYRPTFFTWRHLGINKKEELPRFGEFEHLLERLETAPQVESQKTN